MLKELHIRNLAIIENATIEFDSGLNLITGETGAGKSIIIDSLGLALGNRASSEMVRTGEKSASVTAFFSKVKSAEIANLSQEIGFDFEGEITLRRRLTASGSSKAYINDEPVNLNTLSKIGNILVTIHGQGEGDELLTAKGQYDLYDSFAQTLDLRYEVSNLCRLILAVRRQMAEINEDEMARARELDLLKHQINEIDSARINPEEEAELKRQSQVLQNAERLKELGERGYHRLYESEEALISGISEIENIISELSEFDSRFKDLLEQTQGARYQLEDAAEEIRDFTAGVEADPQSLQEIEARIDLYKTLQRKYGATTEDVLSFLEDARLRLQGLENADISAEELQKELEKLEREYAEKSQELSDRRLAKRDKLAAGVEKHLSELAMEKARFAVDITSDSEKINELGIDQLSFSLSPNPGESMKPLAKIASGGEQSRLMLAIKSCTLQPMTDRVIIFDEIDAGLGGRVADFLGRKLAQLAKFQQIICISHLPQVAAYAGVHSRISKQTREDRTVVQVDALDYIDRIEEIARMLGGEDISDVTRVHAKEILEKAESYTK